MHLCVFALFVSIVIGEGYAQYQPSYGDNVYPYPSYPLTDGRSPNVGYDNRLFWSNPISTTTTTTTTTTTCTVLAAAACAGRRRRSFLQGNDDSIEPSPVNKVEATPLAEADFASRVERKAAPQFAYWRGESAYPYSYQPLSTFGQRPFAAIHNPYNRRPIIAADPRFFLYSIYVTTTTSTTTTTSRSTPICSQPSGFNQC